MKIWTFVSYQELQFTTIELQNDIYFISFWRLGFFEVEDEYCGLLYCDFKEQIKIFFMDF